MSGSDARDCDAILAFTTVDSADRAAQIAEALVRERLAACVSLLPSVTSIYRWKGAVHRESEVLLLIKTTQGRVGELATWIDANHPYDVPEFLCVDATYGGDDYLAWLREATWQKGSGKA